ncbi:AraC family transcriptional regulator [Ruminococcus sp. HUN007]|uniref:helix-turn-helix domain-containing protein n=1 Tax=Ruminococcus sp. HUN007 TaxID=1514668 RepID=UPI0005D1DD01|nr:AraC family transcriptional regulator [Ruminococcus sp. HUN007]
MNSNNSADDNSTNRKLFEHLFTQREENFEHASFDREIAFYESICTGDIEKVKLLATPLCSGGYGNLSKDPLRNLKYHFVVSVAMITRFCISSGMTPEEAYNLSDVYIMKADTCNTEKEVHEMHDQMIISFTKRMRNVRNTRVYSKQVIRAIDYISEHLHDKIKMQDVVDYLNLSLPYFSRLFKSELGVTFSEYVTIKKVEVAADMIRYSGSSILEISNILNFSTQSYFIKVFKKYKGITPNEYKKKYNFFGNNLLEAMQNKNSSSE